VVIVFFQANPQSKLMKCEIPAGTIRRRIQPMAFFLLVIFLAPWSGWADEVGLGQDHRLQASDFELALARELVAETDRQQILRVANAALTQEPLTITNHRSDLSEGGANDFFSMSDYYWPNPDTPDGMP